ncbi:MAG: hypothetical protein AAF446_10020, partial [Pseudomonadota bacterium]
MKRLTYPALFLLLLSPALLQAEIYRCAQDETVIFSDLPCGENAERYESAKGISIIEPPPGLDAIAQNNQAFVEQRQQRRQQALADARERRRQEQEQLQQRYQVFEAIPVFYRPNPPSQDCLAAKDFACRAT